MPKQSNKHIPTPFELFHVECGKGWLPLIEPLVKYIENYNKDKNDEEKIEILQIKEKFGGLRFYTNFYTTELSDMIRSAEKESYITCECCGSKVNVGQTCSGWITTICLSCVKQQANQKTRCYLWKNAETQERYIIHPDRTIKKLVENDVR